MIKNKERSDGRLQSKVYIGDGKYKYVYAHSPKELDKKILDVKMALRKGINMLAERDAFSDWATSWLQIKQTEVSASKYAVYTYRVKNLSSLNNLPISKIRTTNIQKIILDYNDRGYARSTITEIRNTANQIFKMAIANRVIEFNPVDAVKLPAGREIQSRRALTAEEQTWITNTPHRAKRAAMIMMYAGLRRGELIPLTWRDIDLTNKTITINKSVEMIKGKSILKDTTKTPAGMRTIFIPQVLVNYLITEDTNNNLLVCPSAKGKMMSLNAWRTLWSSYMTDLNFKYGDFSHLINFEMPKSKFAPKEIPKVIPSFTAHWLRHTFITLMYLAGIDVLTAKEQAGHSDIKTTMSIYTHLDSVYKQKQISKLDDYLSGNDTNKKASSV